MVRTGAALLGKIQHYISRPSPDTPLAPAAPAALPGSADHSSDAIARGLYRGILGRNPDDAGLASLTQFLDTGHAVEELVQSMLASSEFNLSMMNRIIPGHALPNLVELYPERYIRETTPYGVPMVLFTAQSDDDFNFIETAIHQHRYYDAPGVWSAKIDLDKRITAAIVGALGQRDCLEIGCFTGTVLSLLKEAGMDVVGLDVSHLAFVLAYPNIRNDLVYGDLLSVKLDRTFDVVLAMDIIEHLNPVKFDRYVAAMASLVAADGYVYLNSPMFGEDDVFGEVFGAYVNEWQQRGNGTYWGHLDCDPQGWPMHGHLVWASPQWWEQAFRAKDLVRDRDVERAIHQHAGKFFEGNTGRKCLFVLKHAANTASPAGAVARIGAALGQLADLPR